MFMKPMHRAMALVGAMGLWFGGCNDAPPMPIDEVMDAVHVETISSQGSNQIDVLFVIANSTSVDSSRKMLEQAFPSFVQGLLDLDADFHIGVVTPDMQTFSERGQLHIAPNSTPEPGQYVVIEEGLADTIPCDDADEDPSCQQTEICDADDEYCVICDEDDDNNGELINCVLEIDRDPNDPSEGTVAQAVSCDSVEDPEENVTTTRCYSEPKYCTAPPAELQSCNDRFVPLLDEDGEQATCEHNPDNCSYDSHYPHWEKRCDDLGNSACEDVDGPAGERRCTEDNLCEVKPVYLAARDYSSQGEDEDDLDVDDDKVIEDFACLSNVGTCQIGASTYPERGLDAVYEALNPENEANKGFLRDDALLLIVFVTDDDDCSVGYNEDGERNDARLRSEQCWGEDAEPLLAVQEIYDYVTTRVKSSESQAMAAAIVGPVPAGFVWDGHRYSCSREDEDGVHLATAGDRYSRFVRAFGARGVIGSICEADFEPVLDQVTRSVSRSLGQTCLTSQPKACNPDAPDCGPGVECVQAAPPRTLLRESVVPEEGREDADEDSGMTVCDDVEECLLDDDADDTRACVSGICSIGGEPITCSTQEECIPDGTADEQRDTYVCDAGQCYQGDIPPGTSPRFLCDDFQVTIDLKDPSTGERSELQGPGAPDSLDYEDDRDYEINYYANEACPTTGVSFRFVRTIPEQEMRISYPISLRDEIFN